MAIGCAGVYYARAAQAFNTGINSRHCTCVSVEVQELAACLQEFGFVSPDQKPNAGSLIELLSRTRVSDFQVSDTLTSRLLFGVTLNQLGR